MHINDDYTMGWARVSHRPPVIPVLVHQPILFVNQFTVLKHGKPESLQII